MYDVGRNTVVCVNNTMDLDIVIYHVMTFFVDNVYGCYMEIDLKKICIREVIDTLNNCSKKYV